MSEKNQVKIKGKEKREKIAINVFSFLIIILFAAFIFFNLDEIARITGYGTTGEIKLIISENVTIDLPYALINFSSGYVTPGQAGAWLNSSATNYWASNPRPNWVNLTFYNPNPIVVRNDGNVNVKVNLSSAANAAGFIGGTSPQYQFNASNNETGSCTGTLAAWTALNAATQSVCTSLSAAEASDQIWVHANLFIPSNAVGTKSDSWTFSAIKA